MGMRNNCHIDGLVVDEFKILLGIGKVEDLFNAYSW